MRDIADYVQTPHVEDESLTSVAVRCRGAASKDIRTSFLLMVNCMALVCKCQSIRLRTGDTLKGIHRNEVQKCSTTANIAYRTFMDWHAIGSKFIAIASGGSIYALVLVAGLGLRVSVAAMVGTVHLELANMLRSPPENSPQRKLVAEFIAPTIALMCRASPLSMNSMFSGALIEKFAVHKNVDCTDFVVSDRFFDAIIQNSFKPLPRSRSVWIACSSPILEDVRRLPLQRLNHDAFYGPTRPYSPPLSDVAEDEIEHIVIQTSYDPQAPSNKRFKAPRDKAANAEWSAKERSYAESGERASSINDLRKKLAGMYRQGVKKLHEAYLRIPMSIVPHHHLELRNEDGSLMAFVSTGLPSHIRSSLDANLLAALENPDLLEEKDWESPGGRPFQAMHLSWYNRHCTSGREAPSDVQPWLLEKDGARTNYGQMVPYVSKDLKRHQLIYGTITRVYAELFEWVRTLMETHLQEEFEMLMEIASSLPGNCASPIAPFVSLVINVNVCTKAHRDVFDRHLCLVIPVGHFEGGALCLLENGLVLELRPGDVALFRSSEVTHFNLNYKGARASLVFQTDREFAAWVKNNNGWVDNATMHSFV